MKIEWGLTYESIDDLFRENFGFRHGATVISAEKDDMAEMVVVLVDISEEDWADGVMDQMDDLMLGEFIQ